MRLDFLHKLSCRGSNGPYGPIYLHRSHGAGPCWYCNFLELGSSSEKNTGPTAATVAGVYAAPRAPSSQPRAVLVGHIAAPAIAVTLQKLLRGNSESTLPGGSRRWLLAAVTVALVTALMVLLDCLHPPGVAIAASFVTSPDLQQQGYRYILSSMLGLGTIWVIAIFVGNFLRMYSYPVYWLL